MNLRTTFLALVAAFATFVTTGAALGPAYAEADTARIEVSRAA